jgi:uncharacterized membrane protein YkvA (DUF1232 family)
VQLINNAKSWARQIKSDVVAVYFAARDPRTLLFVRLLAVSVAAYALSPVDLNPDFIPIIGYRDDLRIVPLGLMLVIRLLPPEVLADSRVKTADVLQRLRSGTAGIIMVGFWLLV